MNGKNHVKTRFAEGHGGRTAEQYRDPCCQVNFFQPLSVYGCSSAINSGFWRHKTFGNVTMPDSPHNPVPAVGAIVRHEGRVLLVRRRRPPGKGLWAIPGGRIRLGETLREAAQREVFEETGIVVEAGPPVYSFDLIERDPEGAVLFHYVIVDVLAEYRGGDLMAGDDAADARWVTFEDMARLSVARETRRILKELCQNRQVER